MKGCQILFHSGSRWLFTSWSWWLLWLSFIVIIISWLSRFVNTLIRVFSNYFIDGIQSIHWTVLSACRNDGSKPILCSFVTGIVLAGYLSWGNLKNVIRYEAMNHTVPRVGRSKWTMQLTIIQYFTINSDNGELRAAIHGGGGTIIR